MARIKQTARKVVPAGTPKKRLLALRKPKMDGNDMAPPASTATPAGEGNQGSAAAPSASAAHPATNSGASSHGPNLEALIKDQLAALKSKVKTRATAVLYGELKDAKENVMAALTSEVERMHDCVYDQLAMIIEDAGKDLQTALLKDLNSMRNTKYEDLREQFEEATQKLKESIQVNKAQAARIQDLEKARIDQHEQLKQQERELQETKQQLEEKQQELHETKRKLEEQQQELDKERGLSNMCSHEEKQGLEARVKRIEAALFGQKERGEMASDQELDRSFVEVIPATSPTASPSRHQETLRRARNSSNENDGSHLPTAKRGCAGLSRANRVFDESDSSGALIAGENDEGGAGE